MNCTGKKAGDVCALGDAGGTCVPCDGGGCLECALARPEPPIPTVTGGCNASGVGLALVLVLLARVVLSLR